VWHQVAERDHYGEAGGRATQTGGSEDPDDWTDRANLEVTVGNIVRRQDLHDVPCDRLGLRIGGN
jgi:hypothetical protein